MNKYFLTAALLCASALAGPSARAADIVDTASGSSQFQTLARAIRAAGLSNALSRGGSLTVFAPTDAAFARLPAGTLEELLKPSRRAMLASILKYHVLPRRLSARALSRRASGTNLGTLNGETFALRTGDALVLDPFVSQNARVTQPGIRANNSVIHAIDTVLIPPSLAYALARNPAFKNENR